MPGIEVQAATVKPVNIILQVGDVQQAVTVEGTAPVLQSESETTRYGLSGAAHNFEIQSTTRTPNPWY
ncbi:MAG: hypothetical protein ACKV22_30945 [Bryobacteraceae bacterium]